MATGPVREALAPRRGEVLGITGLRGAGHEHIGRALFGLQAWTGTCRLRGAPYHAANAAEALALGVAYVVGDRTRNGIPVMSVLDNLLMGRWASGPRGYVAGLATSGPRPNGSSSASTCGLPTPGGFCLS